jgi:serine/threonine protein kinase
MLNSHVIKPLCFDYSVEVTEDKSVISYIEIIFEYDGDSLDTLEPMLVEQAYSLMYQSAKILLLLQNLGVINLKLKPSKMLYDKQYSVLKFIDMGNAFIKAPYTKEAVTEYTPPELLQMKESVDPKVIMASDVYCWAMSFCSMLGDRKVNLERPEAEHVKFLDSVKLTNFMGAEFNLETFLSSASKLKRDKMKDIIIKALMFKPEERPTIQQIVDVMDNTEPTKEKSNEKIKDYLEDFKNKRVELKCGHDVSKNDLIGHALKLFFEDTLYEYRCLCLICSKSKELQRLPLDCGCVWTRFGEKVMYDENDCGKCSENKPLTPTDLCLINDYISFELACMMLSDHKESSVGTESFNKTLGSKSVENIVWALENTKLITRLNIEYKNIKIKPICTALKTNESTTRLSLSHSKVADEGAVDISEVLKTNKSLVELNLSDNMIETKGVLAICGALKVNNTLEVLDLYNTEDDRDDNYLNKVECEGTKAIGELLKVNNSLVSLSLTGNEIREGVRFICEGLINNKTLKELSLGNCEINDTKSLSKLLKKNETLTKLDIGSGYFGDYRRANEIKEEGTIAISQALTTNKVLKELNMSYNQIGDKGAIAIGAMLKVNKTLTSLDISANEIKLEGVKAIGEALKVNTALMKLNMRFSEVKESVNSIGEALKVNRSLEELDLYDTKIEDVECIVEALKVNNTLKRLQIECHEIKDEGKKLLKKVKEYNPILDLTPY